MEKKMYYKIDNNDTPVICELSQLFTQLESEASDYNEQKNIEDEPNWVITILWLTQEEYENLPEAY